MNVVPAPSLPPPAPSPSPPIAQPFSDAPTIALGPSTSPSPALSLSVTVPSHPRVRPPSPISDAPIITVPPSGPSGALSVPPAPYLGQPASPLSDAPTIALRPSTAYTPLAASSASSSFVSSSAGTMTGVTDTVSLNPLPSLPSPASSTPFAVSSELCSIHFSCIYLGFSSRLFISFWLFVYCLD